MGMKNHKKCYIHIGAPKTGSTSLQKFFHTNREALLDSGVLYPDVCLRGYGHHDLAFLLNGEYPNWATPQERPLEDLENDLKTAVANHEGDILLSSENFYLLPQPKNLAQLLERCGVTPAFEPIIVVYIRRQDEVQESWYNQTVKAQGSTQTIEESIEEYANLWDYWEHLNLWATVFGKEQMVVCPYNNVRMEAGELYDEFCSILNISSKNFVVEDRVTNTGLNRDILEFQRLVNQLPLSTQEKRGFHKELIELSAKTKGSGIFDEGPLLTFEQRQKIYSRYEKSNSKVAKKFLGSETLFDCPKPDESFIKSSNPGLTNDRIIQILGWILMSGRK